MNKIALFADSPDRMKVLIYLQEAFEELGVRTTLMDRFLNDAELTEFCRQFSPDAIFEYNRVRDEVRGLPDDVVHLGWIVDTMGRPNSAFQGSEITYFFGKNWARACAGRTGGLVSWLPPGFSPSRFFPEAAPPLSDFSFLGHMSAPWSREEEARLVSAPGARPLRFGEVMAAYTERLRNNPLPGATNDDYVALALQVIQTLGGGAPQLSRALHYDFGCRTLRMVNRHRLLQSVVKFSHSLRIYGPGHWRDWPDYAPYHQGFLGDPHQVRRVYQTTRINLHEGVGIHFRVFDCLAAGGFLFYMQDVDDQNGVGIQEFFEPNRHYIPVTEGDFAEKAAFYLARPALCQRLGQEAARLVHGRDTWGHRARQILADYQKIRK